MFGGYMKVKEVFHYLSVLSGWEEDIIQLMRSEDGLLVDVVEHHKKNDVIAEEKNEMRHIECPVKEYSFEDLYNAYVELIEEKEKLYGLIEAKKRDKTFSDSIIAINKSYRNLVYALGRANTVCKKKVTTKQGESFVKTENGVGTIKYEIEVEHTPKYTSKFFLEKMDKYSDKAEKNSNFIDSFNTVEDIEDTPKWSEHSTILDLICK